MTAPAQLDHAGIAARVPHAGSMCLLDRLVAWDAEQVHCVATGHTAADHPLRSHGQLGALAGIEYAAQAMALHGALVAPPEGGQLTPGFIASVRSVRLHVSRLDDVAGALQVQARRLAGDARQVLYDFTLHAQQGGALLLEGRAAVVLNAVATQAGEGP